SGYCQHEHRKLHSFPTRRSSDLDDVSIAGLVREAAVRALEDAEMTWSDIDAVVLGKAPDMFEGVMMPELYLAEALGAVGKPMLRDRKSTRLNSSHRTISYAVFCL